jgi:2',3'-cyclic-nucleotide 2'-phosphodiesterase (5'-nucleotidase family)
MAIPVHHHKNDTIPRDCQKENRIMKKISRKSFLKLAAATTAGTAMAPALMGCAWPDTQDHTPYKGDIVLLLSNDIHSNLGTSKIMSTDGSTRITGGVARMAAAQAGVRHRAFGKTLTLDGGDYSQGTPYQDGYQKGWEILALAEMQVDFCTLGNHEFDVGD